VSALRVALIGVGDVAERDYLPEWHRLAGRAEITVVCGRSPDRVRRIADEHRVDRWSTDYREAVAGDVDAVVNLTPIDTHDEITLAALEAGRHVYSEKPLATTSKRAGMLRDVATRENVVLVCAPSIMLFPQVVLARELIGSGALGTIRVARAQALAGVPPWPGYASNPSPFFAAAAGPLVDLGVYPLHVLTGLLGPVSSVTALAFKSRDSFTVAAGPFEGTVVPIESDDTWQLLAVVGDHCLASVEANFSTVWSSAADCELRGDEGALAFSLFDVAAPVSVLRTGTEEWIELPVAHERAEGPDHLLGIEHLVDCVQDGRPVIPNADHAVHVLQVIEAARDAAAAGTTVAVDPPQGTWARSRAEAEA
jgi:predicted dehydrogenase